MRVRQVLSIVTLGEDVRTHLAVGVALSSKQYRTGAVHRIIRGYDMTTKQLLTDAIALALMAVAFILFLFV
jgi:hypothetical protein